MRSESQIANRGVALATDGKTVAQIVGAELTNDDAADATARLPERTRARTLTPDPALGETATRACIRPAIPRR
jgi:antitoxin (DNA-binding transcriptional repressor) of toxin-antitoxin stability system